jgi:hypothetical protein
MTNKQKFKELCHKSYIGSEKCGGCEGLGENQWKININGDIQTKEGISCKFCKGKGYTIPLEFGCEVTTPNSKKMLTFVREFSNGNHLYLHGENTYDTEMNMEYENLGKPITLQNVLRLVDGDYYISGNGFIFREDFNGIQDLDLPQIDLSKDPKDWSEETWGELLELIEDHD